MASQISHIIYARKYFEKHPALPAYGDEFILGCVFPDIRRIDESIKRKDTHRCFENCDLNFEQITAFEAGWKFHTYCDMKREEILNNCGFYKIKGTTDFWGQAAKQLEDELLYEKYNNWEKLSLLLNNPPVITTPLDVSQETLERWYAMISKYFEKKPSDKTIKIFLCKQPSQKKEAEGIIDALGKLRNNPKAVGILKKVCEEII